MRGEARLQVSVHVQRLTQHCIRIKAMLTKEKDTFKAGAGDMFKKQFLLYIMKFSLCPDSNQ